MGLVVEREREGKDCGLDLPSANAASSCEVAGC